MQPFEMIELPYGPQVLWPDHCVIGTRGRRVLGGSSISPMSQTIIRKGYRETIDSYSGFKENDHQTQTGLAGYLNERGFKRLFICGLATDFCVAWTAVDGVAAGFECVVIEDATRAIDNDGSLAAAWDRHERGSGVRTRQDRRIFL